MGFVQLGGRNQGVLFKKTKHYDHTGSERDMETALG
jgi:hypothetical protein